MWFLPFSPPRGLGSACPIRSLYPTMPPHVLATRGGQRRAPTSRPCSPPPPARTLCASSGPCARAPCLKAPPRLHAQSSASPRRQRVGLGVRGSSAGAVAQAGGGGAGWSRLRMARTHARTDGLKHAHTTACTHKRTHERTDVAGPQPAALALLRLGLRRVLPCEPFAVRVLVAVRIFVAVRVLALALLQARGSADAERRGRRAG